ncbi:MAG TPA: cyclic pyranopterin monophosphate synthase MoaC [Candidatus Kapabacteria bacterium]|jgi:cyclic pyranopterin phosphate synthase|nr:cyclic pyranopterin monophosphate synthase MoaC [Candidatus Kapabacteria bacterium]
MGELTHLDEQGNARMVDVADKDVTLREATAESLVDLSTLAFEKLRDGTLKKGDALATARIAGIMAAKKTPELIPLCHQLPLTSVNIDFELDAELARVRIVATVRVTARTGVEMEALTAASVAALTIYDMCKAVDKSISILHTRLLAKSGGRSGDYRRGDPPRDERTLA